MNSELRVQHLVHHGTYYINETRVSEETFNQVLQLKQQLEEAQKEITLRNEINTSLVAHLKEAIEVIEFYGNHTNWETEILSKRACYKKVFKDCDIERVKVMVGYVDSCGKRAREFINKWKIK